MTCVVAADAWKAWAIVARPYECRSCGKQYGPALDEEIGNKQLQWMREVPGGAGLYGPGTHIMVHDRFNRFGFCRDPECDRFFNYELNDCFYARSGAMTMRRKWRPMPKAANGRHPAHDDGDIL